MTDSQQIESSEQERIQDERADALTALVIVTLAVLAGIHYVYTGGLPAFIANVL